MKEKKNRNQTDNSFDSKKWEMDPETDDFTVEEADPGNGFDRPEEEPDSRENRKERAASADPDDEAYGREASEEEGFDDPDSEDEEALEEEEIAEEREEESEEESGEDGSADSLNPEDEEELPMEDRVRTRREERAAMAREGRVQARRYSEERRRRQMEEEERSRKQSGRRRKKGRKHRKGSGLITALTAALIAVLVLLAVCIFGMIYLQNGGRLVFSLPSLTRRENAAQTQAPTQAPLVPTTAAATANTTQEAADSADEAAAESLEGQEDAEEGSGSAGQALASLKAAFAGDAPAAAETEAQTYSTDEAGNFVIPARQAGSFETEPDWNNTLVSSGDATLDEANRLAAGYDYDSAISLLQSVSGYESNTAYTDAIAEYENEKAQCTPYASMNTITHIFFHSLVVDTSRAFDETIAISKQDGTNKVQAYNEVMTTTDEFCRIISDMYQEGYVLVGIHDIAGFADNGDGTQTMQYKEILLPAGKKPFVLSVDDVSYYEYMTGHGYPSKLVIDENGKVTNEYDNPDGSVIYGSYDVLPILEDFIAAHPDFSYRGARGTIALTGYEGILGYRTCDYWYNWNCDYFREQNLETRERLYYNNDNIEQDKATAKQVADAIKALGWTFASHSWGHRDMGTISYADFVWDSDMWEKEVQPLVGDTDIIIFPKGADIDSWRGYAEDNQKYQYLKSLGFDYFCNVDSSQYWIQIGERGDYFRMGRRDLDGTRMWESIESYAVPGSATDRIADLFDARTVFDWSRPTPVE